MDQSFAGNRHDLSKTQSLHNTVARAITVAQEQRHRVVTLEHLLFALLEDADAVSMLAACNIDMASLKSAVSDYLLRGLVNLRSTSLAEPFLSSDVDMVIANASAAAQETGRQEIDGAIVLTALVGGTSSAAQILTSHGLSFDAAIKSLRSRSTPASDAKADYAEAIGGVDRQPHYEAVTTTASSPPLSPPPMDRGAVPAAMPPQSQNGAQDLTVDDLMASVKEIIGAAQNATPNPQIEAIAAPLPQSRFQAQQAAAPAPPPVKTAEPLSPISPGHFSLDQNPAPLDTFTPPDIAAPAPSVRARPSSSFDFDMDARYGAAKHLAQLQTHGEETSHLEEPAPMARATAEPQRSRLEQALEKGALAENIPREMSVNSPADIEIRLAREEVADLDSGMIGEAVNTHSIAIAEAMTLQLRAPQGGFLIQSVSPETQWVGTKNATWREENYASWRWTITPTGRGRKRLQLILSARTVDARGLIAETVLPEQIIVVNVKINYVRSVKKVASWAAIAMAGGILSHYGAELLRVISH